MRWTIRNCGQNGCENGGEVGWLMQSHNFNLLNGEFYPVKSGDGIILSESYVEGNMQFNMRKLFSANKTKNVVAFVYIVVRSGSELIHNVLNALKV